MGKNINPKSLKGQDKLNRIKDLMGRMNTLNESTSISELDLVKKGPNGVIYGIVRENHKYFIKTTDKKSGQLLAEDFSYIGGLQNKFSEAYDSYAEATKQLNLKFDMLNESFGVESNNNILESDGRAIAGGAGFGFVVEEEEPVEEQKKVLKVDAPAAEMPAETPTEMPTEPSMDAPVEDEVSDDTTEVSDNTTEPTEDMTDDESDPTKKIQKMTGKIGQMLRDMQDVDVDLEKYVINSIVSALHLDKFSEEDVDDIVNKIESEDDEDGEGDTTEMGDTTEEPSMEVPDAGEELPTEEEPETTEPVVAEESFRIKKGSLIESLTKRILKNTINENDEYGKLKASPKSVRDRVNKRREKIKYSSKQMKHFDLNDNGKPFDSEDFKLLRKRRNEGWETMEEHHEMDINNPKSYGKYDRNEYIMDSDIDMVSDYVDCPKCEGMGCSHCNDMGYHLSNDNELGESYDLDIFDSLDVDNDGIRAGIDNNPMFGDGDAEDDFRYDSEFYSNSPGTKERPGTKNPPITKPGEEEKKGPWTKPKTKPAPKADTTNPIKEEKKSYRRKGFYK